jgi:hypothetical protein
MADQTVVLSEAEWQQLTAIIANATGFLTVSKLFQQLQAQSVPAPGLSQNANQQMPPPGDGLDLAPQEHVRRPRN